MFYYIHELQVQAKVCKSDADKLPLPDPFPLPQHFPHRLEVALESGKLSMKEKQAFISEVASSMLRFKRYPDRDDYLCVARAVISKYPFLKPNNGNPYVSIVLVFSFILFFFTVIFFNVIAVGCVDTHLDEPVQGVSTGKKI